VDFGKPGEQPAAPPVVLGFGETVVEALRSAVLGQPLFSVEPWLHSTRSDGVCSWRSIPGTLFCMNVDFAQQVEQGLLRRVSTAPGIPWLRGQLDLLRPIDPRLPSGSETSGRGRKLEHLWLIPKVDELDAWVPADARRFFICAGLDAPWPGRLQRLLIDSLVSASPERPVCVLDVDANPVRSLLEGLAPPLQARALASVIAKRRPELIHLFETPLSHELLRTWPDRLVQQCRLACTILPKPGSSYLEERLSFPEQQGALGSTKVIFFSEDSLLYRSMKVYGLAEPRLVCPYAPWEWRGELLA
jgi:hypothetical protein